MCVFSRWRLLNAVKRESLALEYWHRRQRWCLLPMHCMHHNIRHVNVHFEQVHAAIETRDALLLLFVACTRC